MYERLKLRHLRCFVEIIRQGSLIEAANVLAITQSATSKTLSELEQIVGERLLERNRGGVALTPAGEMFHRYASASLTAMRQGLDLVALIRKDARSAVLLGTLPNLAAEVLPTALQAFKRAHRGVPIRILSGTNRQLLTQLRLAEVDFVVGRLAEPADMMGLHFERLYYERLSVVARPDHPLQSQRPLLPRSIADYTLILPLAGAVIRAEVDRFLISRGLLELHDTIETLSMETARRYTTQADALWVSPSGIVAPDLKAGLLRELAIDTADTEAAVGISTRAEAGLNALSLELIEQVRVASRALKSR